MDFDWTAAQEERYNSTLAFAQTQLNESLQERLARDAFGHAEWRRCGEFGLLGLCAPSGYGGGLDGLSTAHVLEAFGKGCQDMGLVFAAAAHLLACTMPIAEYGTAELKQRFLPRLCAGTWVGANAITERAAGSDVYALQTRATPDGDSYRLSGTKSYVTNGPIADVIVVYASTNPKHGYLGISAFVVEKDTPGLSVGPPFKKMGLTTTLASTVDLVDCRIPSENRLGNAGQGAQIFKCSMQWERICLFAAYLGMLDRQLEQTITFARQRRQFGRPIGKNQAIAHRIADMKLRLESARLLLYRAAWRLDHGQGAALDASLAKVAISEAAVQSSLDAIQIHGSIGFDAEQGIERMLRDALPSTLFSGTSEIQRDIIAGELGL
jgi:L-prolyl-PCP dehydrogenase